MDLDYQPTVRVLDAVVGGYIEDEAANVGTMRAGVSEAGASTNLAAT